MSYTADFGPDRPNQPSAYLATNRGWGDLRDWAESLDADEYPRLHHLIDNCWDDDLDGLAAEIAAALEAHPPSGPVDHTAEGLLEAVKIHRSEGIVVVNAGVPTGDVLVASDPGTDGD